MIAAAPQPANTRHDVLGQRVKTVERQTHVDQLAVQEDAHITFSEEHKRRREEAPTDIDR